MKNYIATLALALAAALPASAAQFIFEDYAFTLRDSSGTPWTLLEDRVQLGMFSGGFTPTSLNLGTWQSNWVSGGSTGYYDGSGPEWSASLTLNDNSLFSVGQQLSLWVFDSLAPSGQWALFTDPTWLVAASTPLDINSFLFGFTEQTQAVYGSLDFDNRIASTAAPAGSAVPEPSTYGLIAGASLLVLVGYRRKKRL